MKERYKSYVNQIHAPAELIENTIEKVKKEENSQKYKNKKKYSYLAAGAIAAMVAVTISVNFSINSVVYTPISEITRINDKSDKYQSMSIESYEKFIGMDLEDLLNKEYLVKSSVNVIIGKDGITPIHDEAVLSLSINEKLLTIKLSREDDIAPEELIDSKESKFGNFKIHFGTDNSGEKLYAAGNISGVNYFMTGNGFGKKEFEKKVEKYLKNMKPFEE